MIGVAGLTAGVARAEPPSAGTAQPYPSKPIRIVVPFTPGGTSDVLARMIGSKPAPEVIGPAYWGSMPTSFTSFAHFARSLRMNAAKFSPISGMGCMP